MRVCLATYSQHTILLHEVKRRLQTPYKHVRLRNWSHRYLVDLLKLKYDVVVHLDEDTFITDNDRLLHLIARVYDHGYSSCGMPDGGIVPTRQHNPVTVNPFFLIINRRKMLPFIEKDPDIHKTRWQEDYRRFSPTFLKPDVPYAYNEFEPFYGFFFWQCKHHLKILYLDARIYPHEPENISTELLDHEGNPFAVHAWYSREYCTYRGKWPRLMRTPLLNRFVPRVRTEGDHYDRINRLIRDLNQRFP